MSLLWCGALPFSSRLEMHLQKGSVHCICNRASQQLAVIVFGVGLLLWVICGCGMAGEVGMESELFCVQLLVWKAGPSIIEAVSMLIVFSLGETSLERQSAALFCVPDIHSKVIL